MDHIAEMPFFPLEITKDGAVVSRDHVLAISDAVRKTDDNALTDMFIVSHGWNNDMKEARQLYDALFTNVAALLPNHQSLAQKRIGIVGIFWPSKKFAESDFIPGGAASLTDGGVTAAALKARLDGLKGTFDVDDDAALEKAKALIDGIDDSVTKQREFVEIIRSLVPQNPSDPADDASDRFLRRDPAELLKSLSLPPEFNIPPQQPGGAFALDLSGQPPRTAGFGDMLGGIKSGIWRLLNYATFYQMKERAGTVGSAVNEVLSDLQAARPDLRMHLAGHSFGARVVTSAVDGEIPLHIASLSLLQGAFSHNGFTEKFDGHRDGFFRKVIAQGKVHGPIVITHTVNDRAVGIAYPLASRVSNDNRSSFGDASDQFGGLGRNGAIKMKADEFSAGRLLRESDPYHFTGGRVYNLLADEFIKDHGDITGRQVANVLLCAATV